MHSLRAIVTYPEVRFQVQSLGGTVFFTPDNIVLSLPGRADDLHGVDQAVSSNVVRMDLLGADPNSQIEGIGRLSGVVNYFTGNDPKTWRTDHPDRLSLWAVLGETIGSISEIEPI